MLKMCFIMDKDRIKEIGRSIAIGFLILLFVFVMVFKGF
ncbi:hypothetical protein Pf1_02409 [Flavobacterium columnare]|nr:hypothetical protein Pf1_02409 [Flavobacterium columnare]